MLRMGCKITDLGLDTLVLEEIVISSTLEPSLIMRLRSSNERFDAAKQTKTNGNIASISNYSTTANFKFWREKIIKILTMNLYSSHCLVVSPLDAVNDKLR